MNRWRLFRHDLRSTQPWVIAALAAFGVLATVGGIGIIAKNSPPGKPIIVPGTPAPVTVVVTQVPASPGAPGSRGPAGPQGPPARPAATSPARPSPSRTPSRTPTPTPTGTPSPTPSPTCTVHDPRDGHCLL